MEADPDEGGEAIDVTDAGPYTEGTEVSIRAEAEHGYEFVEWTATAGSFDDESEEETTFTIPDEDVTVTASFERYLFNVLDTSVEGGIADFTVDPATDLEAEAKVTVTIDFIETDKQVEMVEVENVDTSARGTANEEEKDQEYYFYMPDADVNVIVTLEDIPDPPTVETVSTEEEGEAAQATIGEGSDGEVIITATNVGEFGNDWTVEVIDPNEGGAFFSVTKDVDTKIITISLRTQTDGSTTHSENAAVNIRNRINENLDYFTAEVGDSDDDDYITDEDTSNFTGGENMELEVTWNENVTIQGDLNDFTLEGVGAYEANVVGGVVTLQFDNVEPLVANHQLVIAEAAVESNTFVDNHEETWTYDGTVWHD